jgi:hypothetical protein
VMIVRSDPGHASPAPSLVEAEAAD